YVNVRYRYAICYPSDLLKAEPESPDSDGRTFDGGSGAELSVFGRNNVQNLSLAATVSRDAAEMAGRGGQVTYRAGKNDWAVYSGRSADTVFYSKTLKRGDQFLIFQLKYPQAQAGLYGPIAGRLAQCFALTH
ncbi:MAG: hypothetical protein INR64_00570, partial [Caulobacteraceae bacterium]|nr:hypothetical protein [Caulobacter sp.]